MKAVITRVLGFQGLDCLAACLIVIIYSCCAGNTARESVVVPADHKVRYMDLKNRTISQELADEPRAPENYKFVEVDVVEVVNPKKHSLRFDVHYQDTGGEKVLLGSFSLFPADNPGKFIVSTQGKLRKKGTLLLSLVPPDDVDKSDEVRAGVRKLVLRNE